jgi:hypothetical protein
MRRLLLAVVACLLLALAVQWAVVSPSDGASALSRHETAQVAESDHAELAAPNDDRVRAGNLESLPTSHPESHVEGSSKSWTVRVITRYVLAKSGIYTSRGWSAVVTRDLVRAAHWRDLPRPGYRFGPAVWTGEDGPNGELRVLGDPPLYATLLHGHVVCGSLPISPETGSIEFVLEDGAFTTELGKFDFRVVDAQSRAPVEQAGYWVLPVTTPDNGRNVMFEVGASWDPDRHALVAGRYVLHVKRRSPFAFGAATFDVTPGLVTDIGDIPVASSGAIVGESRGPDGEVLDVDVVILDAATGARAGQVDRRNFKPGFAIAELPPDVEIDVAVDDAAWAAAPFRVMPPTSGVRRDFVLAVERGTSTTFVRSGIDIGLVELRVESAAGLWCWARELAPESEVTARFVPGKFTLHVDRGPSYGAERIAFDVGPEPSRVELPITP